MVFSPKVVNCHRPTFPAFLTFTEYFLCFEITRSAETAILAFNFDFVCLHFCRSRNITEIRYNI